jgi:small subunit ribosomal protein S20
LANIRSAKKKARQAVVARARNTVQRSTYRTLIRNVVKAIDAKDKGKAEAAFKDMVPVLDRYAARGVIHKNKAARHKSRLTERIRALG